MSTGLSCSLAEDGDAVCLRVHIHSRVDDVLCRFSSARCQVLHFHSSCLFSFSLHLSFTSLSSPFFTPFLPFCGFFLSFLHLPLPVNLYPPLSSLHPPPSALHSSLLSPTSSLHSPLLTPLILLTSCSSCFYFHISFSTLTLSTPRFVLRSSILSLVLPPLSSPPLSAAPPPEEHSNMYLMVPKPLDSFNLLRVKGKGLKQKVLHASCEWYDSYTGSHWGVGLLLIGPLLIQSQDATPVVHQQTLSARRTTADTVKALDRPIWLLGRCILGRLCPLKDPSENKGCAL